MYTGATGLHTEIHSRRTNLPERGFEMMRPPLPQARLEAKVTLAVSSRPNYRKRAAAVCAEPLAGKLSLSHFEQRHISPIQGYSLSSSSSALASFKSAVSNPSVNQR